ncbi:uncharacterized protein Z520_12161 [Fonsecaea multimorphosa CBS 102226]|uniref:EF-hand domain-containing protein n=1 Tax=Fonsecaea multimorphosa CBS 102226 TaxID=1442371 RepID=A0A0D2K750_9EURO|nr:uncharacterized protein Z520_12161 [Fonsecaea multimorphosa CBS 102226]KIX92168.1 hypothetical protein Z520_12161 [Fonsecaea multimorphosa CBS 102226]OAL17534.1 hypothetical protein AYO22_11569 [Fonsecaea multimorphosa]
MSSYKSTFNNSPRSSPFRRPGSPGSPTLANGGRPATPPTNRSAASPLTSPSKLKHAYTVSEEEEDEIIVSTPSKSTADLPFRRAQTEPPPSPTTTRPSLPSSPSKYETGPLLTTNPRNQTSREPRRLVSNGMLSQNDNLSKLPPQLLHNMRESFSVLDSNSNGTIDASSVAETLQSLGLHESNLSQFFPPGQPQQMSLPQYLNQLANILVGLSPQQELLNALSAFDDDDSGQIDVAELRAALLSTAPDSGDRQLTGKDIDRAMEGFTGRRILGKNVIGIAGVRGLKDPAPKKGGDVFRYHEFVANLTGGPATDSVRSQSVSSR